MADAAAAAAVAIARRLASCNETFRERAVRHLLTSFLPSASGSLSDADLLKLWKGLFFCFWHSDKPLYQSSLASRLASAVSSPPSPAAAAAFFAAYLATVHREWPGIDAHRLDKFYLLNRRFLHHAFLLLRDHAFEPRLTSQFVSILSERTLLAADGNSSRGLAYHVADALLDELEPFLPISLEAMDSVLAPFFTVLEKSFDKVLVSKVRFSVFDRFLESGAALLEKVKNAEVVEAGSGMEKFGKVGFLMGFSKRFLEIGGKPETVQANRRVLFGLRDAFMKLEKDYENSGVEISAPEFVGAGPVKAVENGEGLDEKDKKKRKKVKKSAVDGSKLDDEAGEGKRKKAEECVVDGGEEETEALKSEKSDKKEKKQKVDKKDRKEKKEKKRKKEKVVESGDASDVGEQSTDASSNEDHNMDSTDTILFDEATMSNLQKQFEKAAAEAGMVNGGGNLDDLQVTPINGKVAKKRKRAKSADRLLGAKSADQLLDASDGDDGSEGSGLGQFGDTSTKKVRFSMKNNLVWKPQNPLPPQSLRLPPSATPRGSALKKGVQPGPIQETPTPVKKTKPKAKSAKKSLKASKKPSSAVKRLRKLQSRSA